MFHLRRRQRLVGPILSSHPQKKLKRQERGLTWTNVGLGALIPLMIGVGTIVISVVNQQLEDGRRKQDQQIASLTREHSQQMADELYYQGVYKTYVEDISNVWFKQNDSFIDNEKKMKYIRTKTLTALEELDWQRKSRLFLFLYETGLLSTPSSKNTNTSNMSLDLSDANFSNILIKSTTHKKYHFNQINLPSVDLTNASFIECQFNKGVDFSDSYMFGAKFTRSKFACSKLYSPYDDSLGKTHVKFDRSDLERSDFSDSYICDISFNQTNLAYSTINGITFEGIIEFQGTNLTQVNRDQSFYKAKSVYPLFLNFSNIDFGTIPLDTSLFDHFMKSVFKMNNVILINGTWIVNKSNLILNGDAETNCLILSNKDVPTNWEAGPSHAYSFPTLSDYSELESASYGNCSFNFTISDKPPFFYQNVHVDDYGVFIDTDQAEYNLSVAVRCIKGDLFMMVSFDKVVTASINLSVFDLPSTNTSIWRSSISSGKIPKTTRNVFLAFGKQTGEECLMDNIELHIGKGK